MINQQITGDQLAPNIRSGATSEGAMIFECFTPGITSMLANAGAQFVIYDMEHTGLGFEGLKWLIASARGLPITPMVRVPRNQYSYIARALDLGARGIMVPMVESAEQAAEMVQASRYPPLGRRGAAFGFAQCDYQSGDLELTMQAYHQRSLLIAQIETERGLEALDAIAATDGVDVLWLGHFDLSNFMGIAGQFDHPAFNEAFKQVAEAAARHGKVAGFMATSTAWVSRARKAGYRMIAAGTDTAILQVGYAHLIDSMRAQQGN
ncbi:MAG: aldolase [Betaproteobacteria bacterium]|nr:aldolase [Betaproteobacteria bacterium]